MEYYKKVIFVLREMNMPELVHVIDKWEEEVKDEASEWFSFSEEEMFIPPKVPVKIDDSFLENNLH